MNQLASAMGFLSSSKKAVPDEAQVEESIDKVLAGFKIEGAGRESKLTQGGGKILNPFAVFLIVFPFIKL